jgi:23S rRNA pseudouridine955/2504/2580 synthase
MLGGVRRETITAERAGQRLDNFLMALPEKPPRSLVYRLIRTGQVRINGGRVKPMRKLALGDEVRIPPLEPAKSEPHRDLKTQQRWSELVASWQIGSGDGWVAFNKPAGLAMHGGSGVKVGLIDMVQVEHPSWQLVHRLDRGTSGVVLVATQRQSLVELQALFKARSITKKYLTLLSGVLSQSQITVNEPLKKIRDRSGQHRVIVDPAGASAKTTFRVLEQFSDFAYCEATIETGRMHQIRVHAQSIGHAVAGDERYNVVPPPKGLKRLFLHAHQLTLPLDPPVVIDAPLPPELGKVLDELQVSE